MCVLLWTQKSWSTCANSITGITKCIVLTITNLSTISTKSVNRAWSVTMVACITGLAHAATCPWVTPEIKLQSKINKMLIK